MSISTQKPHKELGPCEPARQAVKGEKDEGRWSVRSGMPAVRDSHIQAQDAGPLFEAKTLSLAEKVVEQSAWSQNHQVKMMARDDPAFLIAV